MNFIGIILFAVWNGFVIRWKQNKFGTQAKDNNIWHKVGILNRGAVWLLGLTIALSSKFGAYAYIMNPMDIWFTEWWSIAITTTIIIGLCYWFYNYIINKINKWRWDYQKELTTQLYHTSLILYFILLTVLIVLGIIYGLKL